MLVHQRVVVSCVFHVVTGLGDSELLPSQILELMPPERTWLKPEQPGDSQLPMDDENPTYITYDIILYI